MPDPEAPISVIQNSFSGGEITPDLYGRTDLAKVKNGLALCQNFFIDYRGGAKSRPGTQFMGTEASYARLYPFVFSQTVGQTYMLVFTNTKLEFIKNPGTAAYPNSSNAGFIQSSGNYNIVTPYLTADLPHLKFTQINDELIITNENYTRMKLVRITDTNWTLTNIGPPTTLPGPASITITISPLPAGSSDPQTTTYAYALTTVDVNGLEGQPTYAWSSPGIDIRVTQGTVGLTWVAQTPISYYKVYKALPTSGGYAPTISSEFGFIGFALGNSYTDGNVVPDFTQQPPTFADLFAGAQIIGYSISANGANYPVIGTHLTVSDSTGVGAVLYPVMGSNVAAATTGIIGIIIANPGENYTAPTVAAAGGGGAGFTATLSVGPSTGIYPDVSGIFQQRGIYASTMNLPTTIFASRSGTLEDYRKHNPIEDSDSFQFNVNSQQINNILWLQPMPGGLLIGSNAGVQQLTAGSSSPSNPLAITPSNAVIVPQSQYGSADLPPIVVNYDVLFVQSEGNIIRDLQYNFFVNIYLGADLSFYSYHLFQNHTIVSWAYQDIPNKIVWMVREDGVLLSMTYMKEQEVVSISQHNTPSGLYESVAVVREGTEDAVYLSVNYSGTRFIERLCGRVFTSGVSDAWCLDAALSTPLGSGPVSSVSGLAHLNGATVSALIDGVPYVNFGVVSAGSITLPVSGSKVVVGLSYVCNLQPLYLDVTAGVETLQGRRKKIAAWSARVKDSAGFKMGTTSADIRPWVQDISSTDPPIYPASGPGLLTGDARMITDMWFNVGGQVYIRQDQPLPLQVLSIEPEFGQGDTR